MSAKADFFRALEMLAHDSTPGAKQAVERFLDEARRILAIVEAEQLILEGWHSKRPDSPG